MSETTIDDYFRNKAIDLLIADGYSDYVLEDIPDHMLVRILIHEYIKAKNRVNKLEDEIKDANDDWRFEHF
jgi:hypothetical protein